MLYKTHLEIGENTLKSIKGRGRKLIDSKSFLKGNVLPDISPKYRLKKHGRKQFEKIIKEKVHYLTKLNSKDVEYKIGRKKFSIELGIVCHFLCDFFSLPHDEEWGFKESVTLKHIMYEKNMHEALNKKVVISDSYKILGNANYSTFLEKSLKKYRKRYGYHNDLFFAMYLTNSVTRYILECIEHNDKVIFMKSDYVKF